MGTSNHDLEIAELTAILTRQTDESITSTGAIGMKVQTLFQIARRQTNRAISACNVGLTPHQERLQERDATVAYSIAITDLGCAAVRLNNDPRGYSLYLTLPSGRSNSWNGEEWGIS